MRIHPSRQDRCRKPHHLTCRPERLLNSGCLAPSSRSATRKLPRSVNWPRQSRNSRLQVSACRTQVGSRPIKIGSCDVIVCLLQALYVWKEVLRMRFVPSGEVR